MSHIKPAIIESVLRAQTLGSLSDAFAAAVRPLGFDAFAMGRLSMDKEPGKLFLVRWPHWIEHYAVNGYVHDDIVVDESRLSLDTFTWSELKARRPGEGTHVFEACSEFGWNEGFLVPVHGPDSRRGIVTLASRSIQVSLANSTRAELTALSQGAYKTAWKLSIDENAVSLSLSVREQEALAHVAQGRDDAEIAVIMSISKSTAHAHVERAKRRLGATTRAQAVAMAKTAKLI